VLEHQIAVLLGRAPESYVPDPGDRLPNPPPLPAAGVPSELLGRRPDVRAVHARLIAADHNVAVAVANLFPSVRLGATGVYQSGDPARMFDNWSWSLASSLFQPIFEGYRLRAEVVRTKAVVQERLRDYGQTVLLALREVEDALALEREQVLQIEHERARLDLAQKQLEQARSHYVNGITDYLPVLTALVAVQDSERQLLAARRRLIAFRIQVYRALAGGWSWDEAPPAGLPYPQPLPVTEASGDRP
jgi:outer membrane protein TolC